MLRSQTTGQRVVQPACLGARLAATPNGWITAGGQRGAGEGEGGTRAHGYVRDLKGLSGGERTYTTVCFIIALWYIALPSTLPLLLLIKRNAN